MNTTEPHVTINSTEHCYAVHPTKERANSAAKFCRKLGCEAIVLSLAAASLLGQLRNLQLIAQD